MRQRTGVPRPREVVDTYCGAWNERSDDVRCGALQTIWRPDAPFRDPMAELRGPEELSDHIGELQRLCVDLELSWSSPVRRSGQWISFDWQLERGAHRPLRGCDVIEFDPGHRVRQLVGFWHGNR